MTVLVPFTDMAKKFGMVKKSGTTRMPKIQIQECLMVLSSLVDSPYPRNKRMQHLRMVQ